MTKFAPLDPKQFSARTREAFAAACPSRTFSFRAAGPQSGATLWLFDQIGPAAITSGDVAAALRDAGGADLLIRINSPGGDTFEGLAIFNALRAYRGNVEIVIDGIAAGAASIAAMAGSRLTMSPSTLMQIDSARALVIGNRHDLAEGAAMLTKLDTLTADILAQASGRPEAAMLALMTAETWLTGEEAVAGGFADEVAVTAPGDTRKKARVASRPAARSLDCYRIETRRAQLRAILGKGESLPPSRAAVERARRRLRLATAEGAPPARPAPTAAEIAAARARVRRAEADGLRPTSARPATAAPATVAAARRRLAVADVMGIDPAEVRRLADAARRKLVEAARARAAATR